MYGFTSSVSHLAKILVIHTRQTNITVKEWNDLMLEIKECDLFVHANETEYRYHPDRQTDKAFLTNVTNGGSFSVE